MNRLIQVVITTIIITLSFNSFAEAKKTYYESGALEYVVLLNMWCSSITANQKDYLNPTPRVAYLLSARIIRTVN
jgi:hypothetical protein